LAGLQRQKIGGNKFFGRHFTEERKKISSPIVREAETIWMKTDGKIFLSFSYLYFIIGNEIGSEIVGNRNER
jgi:hypothetical protein